MANRRTGSPAFCRMKLFVGMGPDAISKQVIAALLQMTTEL
ncbi:hypothetical protein IMCC9480_2810 [Oxalobacteraceae bacterium IMCC9480]|nr:hypothetical protein IMCC9480_2810 [Oxalobacteraceae bacterium IMCC9480]